MEQTTCDSKLQECRGRANYAAVIYLYVYTVYIYVQLSTVLDP